MGMNRRELLTRLGAAGLAIPAAVAFDHALVPQLVKEDDPLAGARPKDILTMWLPGSYQSPLNLSAGDAVLITATGATKVQVHQTWTDRSNLYTAPTFEVEILSLAQPVQPK